MLLSVPAQAEPQYDCPYLADKTRQTLAPMTQGRDGWFFRAGDFVEKFELLPQTQEYLRRLNTAFAAKGSQLIVLAVPPRSFAAAAYVNNDEFDEKAARKSYRAYLEQLRATGIVVVDMLKEAKPKHFFKRDQHWTPAGAKIAAWKLAKQIRYKKRLSRNAYLTTPGKPMTAESEMTKELQNLCVDLLPPEKFPEFTTVRKSQAGEEALFGNTEEEAPILLLGSSYSARNAYNFEGALAQASGLEVANHALSAGQLFNSMLSYVAKPEGKYPPLVIWEALAHYDFNQNAMFRQILPALERECPVEKAIAVTKRKPTSNQLFSFLPEQKITGPGYYLFLHADTPLLTTFMLEMDYAEGDSEWFMVDRSNFDSSGRFFVELSDEISEPLTEIRFRPISKVNATIEARLCRY